MSDGKFLPQAMQEPVVKLEGKVIGLVTRHLRGFVAES
jgi:hypothetical protein